MDTQRETRLEQALSLLQERAHGATNGWLMQLCAVHASEAHAELEYLRRKYARTLAAGPGIRTR